MHRNDLALTAHLMRRAGFGATREELEGLASRPYEDLVEDLVHPERLPEVDADVVQRYYLGEGVYVQVCQKEAIHLTRQQMSVPRRSATLHQE